MQIVQRISVVGVANPKKTCQPQRGRPSDARRRAGHDDMAMCFGRPLVVSQPEVAVEADQQHRTLTDSIFALQRVSDVVQLVAAMSASASYGVSGSATYSCGRQTDRPRPDDDGVDMLAVRDTSGNAGNT